jgi:hypothetical protein
MFWGQSVTLQLPAVGTSYVTINSYFNWPALCFQSSMVTQIFLHPFVAEQVSTCRPFSKQYRTGLLRRINNTTKIKLCFYCVCFFVPAPTLDISVIDPLVYSPSGFQAAIRCVGERWLQYYSSSNVTPITGT